MRFLSLTILILTTVILYPQSNKIYIDITAGATLPIGKYAAKNLATGSFTELGGNASIDISWMLKKPFGINATFSGIMNPVDVSTLGWAKVIADPFLSDVNIRSDPYLHFTVMLGPMYERHIYKNLSFQLGINAGVMKSNTPYQLYKPQYFMAGPQYYEITSAGAYSFALRVFIDLELKIRNSWSLIMQSAYTNSSPEFTFWTATEVRKEKKPVSFLNANFGIRLKL